MRMQRMLSVLLVAVLLCEIYVAPNYAAYARSDMQNIELAPWMRQGRKPQTSTIEKYLFNGKLEDGENAVNTQLLAHSGDDHLRFGLGVIQFLRAIERLVQDLRKYGMHNVIGEESSQFHVSLPSSPKGKLLTYVRVREIAQTFLDNLSKSEATLSKINDPDVKLPLHFGMIRLDLNGDGKVSEQEALWKLYAQIQGRNNITISPEQAEQFVIAFDRGDVHWLRGYCHLLMAVCEIYLAHDTKETFDCTAHIFFNNVDSPYKFLAKPKDARARNIGFDVFELVDLVAVIHLIRWKVIEPQRMAAALHHLEAVAAQSKESWKWIMAETDDDREWIPNPRQTGVLPGVRVTEEMVTAWSDAMSEAEKLLSGELLIPFWRGDDGLGVNLRKVFLEPRNLDVVLWVQGTAAAPYLEKGNLTKSEAWTKLPFVFGDHFPGFAVWFN